MSLKSDFIQFLYDLIHVYSRRSGADNPRGQNFGQQKSLVTLVICYKFKKISLKSDFIQFFQNRNVLSLHSFVASLKKCLILYNFYI